MVDLYIIYYCKWDILWI